MGIMEVLLHRVDLKSELVIGDVIVGVHPSLLILDVTFILGNYLAGCSVWSCPNVPSEVVSVMLIATADDSVLKYPEVFSACAVTFSMVS